MHWWKPLEFSILSLTGKQDGLHLPKIYLTAPCPRSSLLWNAAAASCSRAHFPPVQGDLIERVDGCEGWSARLSQWVNSNRPFCQLWPSIQVGSLLWLRAKSLQLWILLSSKGAYFLLCPYPEHGWACRILYFLFFFFPEKRAFLEHVT